MIGKSKWLVRAGSAVIVLAFFLPALLVSSTGLASTSYSLLDLARQSALVYLLLIGAFVAGGISFFAPDLSPENRAFYWVELTALTAGLLAVLGAGLISPDFAGLQFVPGLGIFVLVLGVALFTVGWIIQWRETCIPFDADPIIEQASGRAAGPEYSPGPPDSAWAPGGDAATLVGARLEVIQGSLPSRCIPITHDDFTLGRSSKCDLQLPDTSVSRLHARLRVRQGVWYIQDQGSRAGLMVNHRRVQAVRLNGGDHIAIGPFHFLFYD
jgi:hypothetical protein